MIAVVVFGWVGCIEADAKIEMKKKTSQPRFHFLLGSDNWNVVQEAGQQENMQSHKPNNNYRHILYQVISSRLYKPFLFP